MIIDDIQLIQTSTNKSGTTSVWKIKANDENRWILKSVPYSYANKLERQIMFSEMLRCNGMPIPQKRRWGEGGYILKQKVLGHTSAVTLEDYFGQDLENVSYERMEEIGCLLGKLHSISEKNPMVVAQGAITMAVMNGSADYLRLFNSIQLNNEEKNIVQENCIRHDRYLRTLKDLWYNIPGGVVHGDMGIYNNLVVASSGELGIIDFNMAGYEPFICDFLCVWFGSIYKWDWQKRLKPLRKDLLWENYYDSYTRYRNFTKEEIKIFPSMSSFFHGIFYTKYLIELRKHNKNLKINNGLQQAMVLFENYALY